MPLTIWCLQKQTNTQVLDALADGTVPEEDPDERDVESRAACVRALGCVCTTLLAAGSSGSSESQHAGEAEEALSASAVTLLGKVGSVSSVSPAPACIEPVLLFVLAPARPC